MADNLHKLAIQIQGDIDAKFGDSIKDMTGHLKQLEDGVKTVSESKVKPDSISREFIRMNHEAGVAALELNKLNQQMRQTDGYTKQRKETAEAAQKLRDARNEVRRLEAAQKESGTKEFSDQIKAARKEATAAERAYNKQKSTLTTLDGKLKEAGIDTKNMASEQKRLSSEIEDATDKSKKLGDQMERLTRAKYYFGELRGHVKQLGADLMWVGKTWLKMGAAIGAGGFALYKISDSVAAAGDAAAKSAAKLHMGTEAFQELQYAASMSGVKGFDAQMLKFNATLAKAAGNTKSGPGKELKDLGINVKQFAKMKPEFAIMAMADQLNKIKDPAKRARAEMALFGESGAEMGAFLKIGSNGIQELSAEARATGLVISEQAAKQAEAFNDARDKMKGTISGLKNIVGTELIPVFTEVFGEMSQFFIDNQGVVKEFAATLGVKFREMVPVLGELARGAGKLISVFWNMGRSVVDLVGGAENMGIIIAALPLAKTALSIGRIAGSLVGLINNLSGVSSGIGLIAKTLFANPIGIAIAGIATAGVLIYKNWEPIKEFFSGLWDSFTSGVESAIGIVQDTFASLPGWLQGTLGVAGDAIAMPFKIGFEVVSGIVGIFKGDFADIPSAIKSIFAGVGNIISEPFTKAFGTVKQGWANLKGWLGIGPTINAEVEGIDEARAKIGGRARGGRQDTPAVINFAERGAEVAVPLGLADRSFGISSLNMASRGMGLGDVVKPTGMEDRQEKKPFNTMAKPINMEDRMRNAPAAAQNKQVSVKASFPMPAMSITVNGGDPEEIRRTILDTMREFGAAMIPEWQEEIARAAYATG